MNFSRDKENFTALQQNYKLLRCDHLINRMRSVTLKRRRQMASQFLDESTFDNFKTAVFS